MPSTPYGNLGLVAPIGSDFQSEYRVSITQHAQLLGNAMVTLQGTFANRAAVVAAAFPSGAPFGLVYIATDDGTISVWKGSAWSISAWVPLTLSTNVNPVSGDVPSARLVNERVWLSGSLLTLASFTSGDQLFTIPSAVPAPPRTGVMLPPAVTIANVIVPIFIFLYGSRAVDLQYATLSSDTYIYLDGYSYPIT